MLACRACRRPLTAAEGCAVCASVKANLMTTEENAEEFPALSDVSGETVKALQSVLRRHRKVLKEEFAEPEVLETAESAVIKVANTLAKVLDSARKLQSDGLAVVRNMGFQERAELFINWYATLPPLLRKKVQGGMTAFEGQVSAPVPALSAGDGNASGQDV